MIPVCCALFASFAAPCLAAAAAPAASSAQVASASSSAPCALRARVVLGPPLEERRVFDHGRNLLVPRYQRHLADIEPVDLVYLVGLVGLVGLVDLVRSQSWPTTVPRMPQQSRKLMPTRYFTG